jgi:hypothetical protein
MNRRNFLKLTGFGAAAITLPGVGMATISLKQAITGIILREFSYLDLEKEGVEQFAQDYLTTYPDTPHYFKTRMYYALGFDSKQSKLVNHFADVYLRSTDFFYNKMDESKPVRYLGLYNPYKRPCANPFSNIYYPQSQAV